MAFDTGSTNPRKRRVPVHLPTGTPTSTPQRRGARVSTVTQRPTRTATPRQAHRATRQAARQGPLHLTKQDSVVPIPNALGWAQYEARRLRALAAARQSVANIIANAPSYLRDANPKVNLDRPLSQRSGMPSGYSIAGLEMGRQGGGRLIKIAQNTTQDLALPRYTKLAKRTGQTVPPFVKKGYQQAKQILLHELVHANQPASGLPRWLVEGGAELLSRKVSRAEGNTYRFDTHHPYQPFVRRVKKHGGAPYVRRTLRH